MTRAAYTTTAACLLLLASMLPICADVRAQAHTPLLVIVGVATGVTDVSLGTLRRAFQGEPAEYERGKRYIPFNYAPGTPERIVFDRVLLGLEPGEVGRYWIDRRIRLEGQPPRTLPSVDIAPKLVASLPGAIAYVRSLAPNARVRVLTVDGKAPTHPEYPFVE